jgi:hypothetical protein
MFDFSIGNFDLATHLWVKWGGNLVGYEIFLHKLFKNLVEKMLAPISDDSYRSTKMSKEIILQELEHDFMVISFARNGLGT